MVTSSSIREWQYHYWLYRSRAEPPQRRPVAAVVRKVEYGASLVFASPAMLMRISGAPRTTSSSSSPGSSAPVATRSSATRVSRAEYDLKSRAVALGWPEDKIHVIDIDQGRSGASAADRAGFQHLVAEVCLGRPGSCRPAMLPAGLRLRRLAAARQDLAHTDTLICDEDGLYDPAIFDDRVLPGMKGQIPEFELRFLRARMRGGILAEARRGELALALPAHLVRNQHGQVTLDPDAGVRNAVRCPASFSMGMTATLWLGMSGDGKGPAGESGGAMRCPGCRRSGRVLGVSRSARMMAVGDQGDLGAVRKNPARGQDRRGSAGWPRLAAMRRNPSLGAECG